MRDMKTPNIVKEYHFGAAKVKIADNLCRDRTEKEIKEIMNDVAKIIAVSGKETKKEKTSA